MESESAAEYVERLGKVGRDEWTVADCANLIALARRGAAVQMISQRLVQRNSDPPVVETTYITREPYIPPAGETND